MFFNVFLYIHILLFYSVLPLLAFISAYRAIPLYSILALFWGYSSGYPLITYWIIALINDLFVQKF